MKLTSFLFIFILFISSTQLFSQTDPSIQEIIEQQKSLYNKLTQDLSITIDSCNTALLNFKNLYNFEVSLLTTDSINKTLAPGEIDFPLPFDTNDLLLILDRLKMRNNSINQVVKIVADETSYLKTASKTFNAKDKLHAESLEAAEKRFQKTET